MHYQFMSVMKSIKLKRKYNCNMSNWIPTTICNAADSFMLGKIINDNPETMRNLLMNEYKPQEKKVASSVNLKYSNIADKSLLIGQSVWYKTKECNFQCKTERWRLYGISNPIKLLAWINFKSAGWLRLWMSDPISLVTITRKLIASVTHK